MEYELIGDSLSQTVFDITMYADRFFIAVNKYGHLLHICKIKDVYYIRFIKGEEVISFRDYDLENMFIYEQLKVLPQDAETVLFMDKFLEVA